MPWLFKKIRNAGASALSAPVFVGLLLLAAATLKLHQLVTEPYLSAVRGGVDAPLVALAIGAVELFLGTLLVTGFRGPRVRWATVALFLCFLVVSLTKAFGGAASCGCLGRIPVSPWWSAALDLGVLSALVWPRDAAWRNSCRSRRATTIAIAGSGVLSTLVD